MSKIDTKKLLEDCLEALATDASRIKEKSSEGPLERWEGTLLTDYIKVLASLEKIQQNAEFDSITELSLKELEEKAEEIIKKKKTNE